MPLNPSPGCRPRGQVEDGFKGREDMRISYTPRTLFGAMALLAFGVSLAGAQVKPKSQKRIPIAKEAPGEVSKVDTVTVYKTDTMRVTTQLPGTTDTVRLTNTVYRVDTVTVAPPMKPLRLPGAS